MFITAWTNPRLMFIPVWTNPRLTGCSTPNSFVSYLALIETSCQKSLPLLIRLCLKNIQLLMSFPSFFQKPESRNVFFRIQSLYNDGQPEKKINSFNIIQQSTGQSESKPHLTPSEEMQQYYSLSTNQNLFLSIRSRSNIFFNPSTNSSTLPYQIRSVFDNSYVSSSCTSFLFSNQLI